MVKPIYSIRKFLFYYFTIIIVACKAFMNPIGGSYSAKEILEMSRWKFDLDISKDDICQLGLIDGHIFEIFKLDSVLSEYKKSDFGKIEFLPVFQEDSLIHYEECSFILNIQKKGSQSEDEKFEILEEVRDLFNQNLPDYVIASHICAKCPVLNVDNQIIENPFDRKIKVDQIDVKEIVFISFIKHRLNPSYFGSSAEAGIVEIFTK